MPAGGSAGGCGVAAAVSAKPADAGGLGVGPFVGPLVGPSVSRQSPQMPIATAAPTAARQESEFRHGIIMTVNFPGSLSKIMPIRGAGFARTAA